ncbi:hypothetical protein [Mangrovimonas aestuarii]|uniref:hypothetical protein n=1 Tax=Mangrovimonas aestuarii TaxID=3018443 RepID=UPI002379490A|nr:hypothetical protein [Mangrovimonas aestuarii]
MNILKNSAKIIGFMVMLAVVGCKSEKKQELPVEEPVVEEPKVTLSSDVHVETEHMEFKAPDSIPSGWVTFTYENLSFEPHFFILEKLPEGKRIDDYKNEVIPVFQNGMDLLSAGKTNEGFESFGALPEWFGQVVICGGSGLISPKVTSVTTLKLEPGYYLMECYVKMSNGQFHSDMGMLKSLVVSETASEKQEPSATRVVTVSKAEGMSLNIPMTKGAQTIEVLYGDQEPHANFVGHDVHLVALEEGANLEDLEHWMDWTQPKGMMSPGPAGSTFMGGVQEMQAGNKGYFDVDLKPGKYAFISEVPEPSKKNLMLVFKVE